MLETALSLSSYSYSVNKRQSGKAPEARLTGVQMPDQPIMKNVTLGKLFKPPVPQIPCLS